MRLLISLICRLYYVCGWWIFEVSIMLTFSFVARCHAMGYWQVVRKRATLLIRLPKLTLSFISSAWFFFKTMNVSGAEAVVAAASPWIGQGESACLVKPYVDLMTDSEIHLTMTSGTRLSPNICAFKLIDPFQKDSLPSLVPSCRLTSPSVSLRKTWSLHP